jgi:hypothetical protein
MNCFPINVASSYFLVPRSQFPVSGTQEPSTNNAFPILLGLVQSQFWLARPLLGSRYGIYHSSLFIFPLPPPSPITHYRSPPASRDPPPSHLLLISLSAFCLQLFLAIPPITHNPLPIPSRLAGSFSWSSPDKMDRWSAEGWYLV